MYADQTPQPPQTPQPSPEPYPQPGSFRPIYEPELSPEDTQPSLATLDDEPRRGCGRSLLIMLVMLVLFVMAAATVGLAAVAGYRDGGMARQTQRAVALAATAHRQATLGWQDLGEARYELAFKRCDYVRTLQPFYPEMVNCMGTAQAALNATATPTITPTPLPPTATPTETPLPNAPTVSQIETYYSNAQDAVRRNEYEEAMRWLEVVRSLDPNYNRRQVEEDLVTVYTNLAYQYRNQANYSAMIQVIEKALKFSSLSNTDWPFTIEAAKLYLSAKGYLEAGEVGRAANVFANLMSIAPLFSTDTRALACDAFSKAGDTANFTKYCG